MESRSLRAAYKPVVSLRTATISCLDGSLTAVNAELVAKIIRDRIPGVLGFMVITAGKMHSKSTAVVFQKQR